MVLGLRNGCLFFLVVGGGVVGGGGGGGRGAVEWGPEPIQPLRAVGDRVVEGHCY